MAQQENAPNKPVHLMFLCGTIVVFYLTQWSIDWFWGYFVRTPDEFIVTVAAALFAVALGTFLYRNDRVFLLANEVSAELGKVTWPTAKEVRAATLVVVIMAIVSALILGVFDFVWAQLTEVVYG
ncbi:MAG: preprotein translocase subunit SecE [Kofleriaceae bacterium]|nr:preprotein translocase subunit SecE [Myxococcales bacterium]MCB9570930.1 preprotein translocase subunit SecE [Kofleriaceae bacterium]